jgi:hypothetical protein
MLSESIDADAVNKNPMNFAIAIPRLAANAARIARVPPFADTIDSLRCD